MFDSFSWIFWKMIILVTNIDFGAAYIWGVGSDIRKSLILNNSFNMHVGFLDGEVSKFFITVTPYFICKRLTRYKSHLIQILNCHNEGKILE